MSTPIISTYRPSTQGSVPGQRSDQTGIARKAETPPTEETQTSPGQDH